MPKKLRKFYERQNEQLDGFEEVDEILENARTKAATGELIAGMPVCFFAFSPPSTSVLSPPSSHRGSQAAPSPLSHPSHSLYLLQRTAEKDEVYRTSVAWAINLNIVINIILLGAKIAVVLLSHSMSLVASTVDSAMDFLSTLVRTLPRPLAPCCLPSHFLTCLFRTPYFASCAGSSYSQEID